MLCSVLTTVHLGDYTPFVDAICADPLSPTPRLALADWLDETGRPGADAIRAWVAAWPQLIADWERGRDVDDIRRELPDLPPPAGTLAIVLAHRLTLAQWPIPWDMLTASWASYVTERVRPAIDEALTLVELAALGALPDDVGHDAVRLAVRVMMRGVREAASWERQMVRQYVLDDAGLQVTSGTGRRQREAADALDYAGLVTEVASRYAAQPICAATYIAVTAGSVAYATTPRQCDTHVDLGDAQRNSAAARADARRAFASLVRSKQWTSLRTQLPAM